MKREDLLKDDEALDRALAELGQTRMPRRKSARLSRVALGAAGLLGISSGLPAWAIGALVTGGLTAGAGTAYLATKVVEEGSSSLPAASKAGPGRAGRGAGKRSKAGREPLVDPAVDAPEPFGDAAGSSVETSGSSIMSSGAPVAASGSSVETSGSSIVSSGSSVASSGSSIVSYGSSSVSGDPCKRVPSPACGRGCPKGRVRVDYGVKSATSAPSPGASRHPLPPAGEGKHAFSNTLGSSIPATTSAATAKASRAASTPVARGDKSGDVSPLALPESPAGRLPASPATSSRASTPDAPAKVASVPHPAASPRAVAAPPPSDPHTGAVAVAAPPPSDPSTGAVAVVAPPPSDPHTGAVAVAAPPPSTPHAVAVAGSLSPAPGASVATPAPVRNALELELGVLTGKSGASTQVLGGGPAVRLAWRHGSGEPGLRGWTAIALSTGPREGLDPQALRWGYGMELGAGLGAGRRSLHIDAGWNLGGRWIPATAQASSPDDLENAGWLFLGTGPELEARFGPPDRWGVVIRLNAEATWLNEAEEVGAAPVLRVGYGGWVGVTLPLRR